MIAEQQETVVRLVPPSQNVEVPPEAVTAAERVITAYQATMAEAGGFPDWQPQGLWASIGNAAHAPLAETLARGDAGEAATLLEGMFADKVTVGLSMAGELEYLTTEEGRSFYVDWWVNGLADLAVHLALATEEAESGKIKLEPGAIDTLFAAVEDRLGIEITFPRVCNAWGIEFDGKLIPRTVWRNLYSAVALHQEIRVTRSLYRPRIIEVGAGFGGVAYWLQQIQPGIEYRIFDLPLVAALSGYFLLRSLPAGRVSLHGERGGAVRVLPHWLIEQEPDSSADVVFNQDSLPEMPEPVARRYLQIVDRVTRGSFYSDNQEPTVMPDGSEVRLPDMEDAFTRLRRVSRHRSWMRRGYFETIYRPSTRKIAAACEPLKEMFT